MKSFGHIQIGLFRPHPVTLGVFLAFATAASYGATSYIASQVVNNPAPPLIVSSHEAFLGLTYLSLVSVRALKGTSPLNRKGLVWATIAGVFFAVGVLSFYIALGMVPLSIAAPLVGCTPLAAYAVVLIVLRHSERITLRAVLGTTLVVAGIAMITTYNI